MTQRGFNLVAIGLLTLMGLTISSTPSRADAIISSGSIFLGVNDEGHLNVPDTIADIAINSDSVGLTYAPIGDATSPGCLCEGWGVAGDGIFGQAAEDLFSSGGIVNITVDSFVSTATTATSVVHLTSLPGLSVTQAYAPSAAPTSLFENKVTITNSSLAKITDVRYTRAMDWDVPPTEFDEYVTISGTSASALLFSSDNGFADPNPFAPRGDLSGCGTSTDFSDCGPDDHGAIFDFGFGDLEAGESVEFSIFYGATPSEVEALAALGIVGAEVFSFGQSSDPGGETLGIPATFIFGFKGVGGTALPDPTIPEPSSIFLLGSGLAAFARFKRKKVN